MAGGFRIPAAWSRDARFRASTPGARWVYAELAEAGEVVVGEGEAPAAAMARSVPGLQGSPVEHLAGPLAELLERGLAELGAGRLVACEAGARQNTGPRGGASGAARMAAARAKRASLPPPPPAAPDGPSEDAQRSTPTPGPQATDGAGDAPERSTPRAGQSVTFDPFVTGLPDPSQPAKCDGSVGQSVTNPPNVTGGAPRAIRHKPTKCDGSGGASVTNGSIVTGPVGQSVTNPPNVTGRAAPCPPAQVPPPLPSPSLPHTPSLSLLSPPPPSHPLSLTAGASGQAREAPALPPQGAQLSLLGVDPPPPPKAPERANHVDPVPAVGTLAWRVWEAILADGVLRPITRAPGDFALRITADGAYPGVDVLAEVLRAGERAARRRPGYYRDGRSYLANWLRTAATDAAHTPSPVAGPPSAGRTPTSPGPVPAKVTGPLPPAPGGAWEHAELCRQLGVRWRAPTDPSADRDAAFLAQTGLTTAEARRRIERGDAPKGAQAAKRVP